MANLYIWEFGNAVSSIGSALAQVPPAPPVANQVLAISGTSNPSAAFNAATNAVMLVADGDCSVNFGTSVGSTPTAVTGTYFLPSKVPLMFAVSPGQKVAVVT